MKEIMLLACPKCGNVKELDTSKLVKGITFCISCDCSKHKWCIKLDKRK